jgi:hypothetical protein
MRNCKEKEYLVLGLDYSGNIRNLEFLKSKIFADGMVFFIKGIGRCKMAKRERLCANCKKIYTRQKDGVCVPCKSFSALLPIEEAATATVKRKPQEGRIFNRKKCKKCGVLRAQKLGLCCGCFLQTHGCSINNYLKKQKEGNADAR